MCCALYLTKVLFPDLPTASSLTSVRYLMVSETFPSHSIWKNNFLLFIPLVLKVWCSHQHHQQHLGICEKWKFSVSIWHLLKLWGMGLRNVDFNKSSRWFWYKLKFKNHYSSLFLYFTSQPLLPSDIILAISFQICCPPPLLEYKLSWGDLVPNISPAIRIVSARQQALKKDFKVNKWFATLGLAQPIKNRVWCREQSVNASCKFQSHVTSVGWWWPRENSGQ